MHSVCNMNRCIDGYILGGDFFSLFCWYCTIKKTLSVFLFSYFYIIYLYAQIWQLINRKWKVYFCIKWIYLIATYFIHTSIITLNSLDFVYLILESINRSNIVYMSIDFDLLKLWIVISILYHKIQRMYNKFFVHKLNLSPWGSIWCRQSWTNRLKNTHCSWIWLTSFLLHYSIFF